MGMNKKLLMTGSALLIGALAVPVAANQNLANLRGAFPSHYKTTDQAYIQADPQYWQSAQAHHPQAQYQYGGQVVETYPS